MDGCGSSCREVNRSRSQSGLGWHLETRAFGRPNLLASGRSSRNHGAVDHGSACRARAVRRKSAHLLCFDDCSGALWVNQVVVPNGDGIGKWSSLRRVQDYTTKRRAPWGEVRSMGLAFSSAPGDRRARGVGMPGPDHRTGAHACGAGGAAPGRRRRPLLWRGRRSSGRKDSPGGLRVAGCAWPGYGWCCWHLPGTRLGQVSLNQYWLSPA
jgi:hypothetical protein